MKSHPVTVYLPDTKDVTLSPFGSGNLKLGFGVYTYSRPAGRPQILNNGHTNWGGTCPGSTDECENICYAKKVRGIVHDKVYVPNMLTVVPPIPVDARYLRLHVSGDFDSVAYIQNWRAQLSIRPDVFCWAYTRSWRVPELLAALEQLRLLPNVQLFASMDPSLPDELPPVGWRRAWIWRDWDGKDQRWPVERRLRLPTCRLCQDKGEYEGEFGPQYCMNCTVGDQRQSYMKNLTVVADQTPAFVCPEETGDKKDCLDCGYCFAGQKHDVVFLEH